MATKKDPIAEQLEQFDKHCLRQRQVLETSLQENGEQKNWIIKLGVAAGMSANQANVSNAMSYLEKFVSTALAEEEVNEQWAAACGYTSFARAKMAIGSSNNRNEVLASKVPTLFQTLPPASLIGKTHTEINRMKRCLPDIHREIIAVMDSATVEGYNLDAELAEITEQWKAITDYGDVRVFYDNLIIGLHNIKVPEAVTHRDLAELIAEKAGEDVYFGLNFKEDLQDALDTNPVLLSVADWTYLSALDATSILVAAANHVVDPTIDQYTYENMLSAFCQALVEEGLAVLKDCVDEDKITYRDYIWSRSVDLHHLQGFFALQVEESRKAVGITSSFAM